MSLGTFLSNFQNECDLLNSFPFLTKVAVDSPSPVPGYLFHNINALTYIDSGLHCKNLIEYFMSKLKSKSAVIKVKVLKMLVHLIKNGHNNVVNEVKLHEVLLKQTIGLTGPLGSEQEKICYDNIRKMSKELLEQAFSEENAQGNLFNTPECQGPQKMDGYGSQASSKKLIGFGNTFDNTKSIGEHVTTFVDKLLSPSDTANFYEQQAVVLSEPLPRYTPVTVDKSGSRELSSSEIVPCPSEFSASSQKSRRSKKVHIAGRAGGGWEEDDDVGENSSNVKDCSIYSMSSDSQDNQIEESVSVEWIEEQKVVDEFATEEPLEKLQLSEVSSLCQRCAALNCDRIVDIFVSNIMAENGKEMVKLRCLVFLEYLLHYDVITSELLMRIAIPKLKDVSQDSEVSVQNKAKKVCLIVERLNKQQHSPKQKSIQQ